MSFIEFGAKTRRDHYLIDPDLVYTNHGSYGPCPKVVHEELRRLRLEQERSPDHWFRISKYTIYADCVRLAARRLDCDFEQIVLVDNATVGANAVIKSAKPGGSILCTNFSYGAVLFTIEEAAKLRGLQVRMVKIRLPIESKQTFIQQFKDELSKGDTENIRLAVVDHITSSSAILLPIAELTELFHSYNIPVLVDGAHGPGQVSPNLSLRSLKCDYYIGTFHKWMYAARGCSFLFVRDPTVASALQPANTSWGYRPPAIQLDQMTHFHLQFFHQGTRDESALFTLPKAIEFADSLAGGFERIHQYNSSLSQQAKAFLEERWNTQGNDIAPSDMHAPYLKMIRLPDLEEYQKTEEDGLRLSTDFMMHQKLVAMTMCVNKELYIRISSQIHNCLEDYKVLAEKIDELRKKRLRSLCIRQLIANERFLHACLQQQHILAARPANIFYAIGQEAIFMNEYQILEMLLAYWPLKHVEIVRLLPLSSVIFQQQQPQQQEEEVDTIAKYLERKLSDGSTLLDYIVMGLVNKHQHLSRLKVVDFHGCSSSVQMTKELFRLPLLWTSPERRCPLQKRTNIEKTKLEKYLEGFNYVYQHYDKSIAHEANFEPIKIILDCQIINEDTLIGLELQQLTPFRFHFHKLWINNNFRQILTSHTSFDLSLIFNLTNVDNITHLHLSDTNMEITENELTLLVRSLSNLRNLRVLCLQRVLNLYPHRYTTPQMLINLCTDFNRLLRRLIYLRKLDLSYSYLQSYIRILFSGLVQPLEYLSLQDCRLVSTDLEFLVSMRNLRYLNELNLSMNNFGTRTCANSILQIIPRCPQLTILSIGYCSLQASTIEQLADWFLKEKHQTKITILSFKSIIPYYNHEFDSLLQKFGQIQTLKKLLLFPQLHTYPGANDDERELVARELYRRCCQTLQTLNRSDIELL